MAEIRRNEEDYRRVLRVPAQPHVIQINSVNRRRQRSPRLSKSQIVNYFKNEVETINFKKPDEKEEELDT